MLDSSLFYRPLQASSRVLFDFAKDRHLAKQAFLATMQETGHTAVSFIKPFGFEIPTSSNPIHRYWSVWPTRHYPVIGYDKMNKTEAEYFGSTFLKILLENVKIEYPLFYDRLKCVSIHNCETFSWERERNGILRTNTITLALFPTSAILDHYANYITVLFGSLVAGNMDMPEIRAFEHDMRSKIGRNRFFQEIVMCERIASLLLGDSLPAKTEAEEKWYLNIFNELRQFNLAPEVDKSIKTMAVTSQEKIMRDTFFERLKTIRASVAKMDGPLVTIRSPAYYNGKNLLQASLPASFIARSKILITSSYLAFPDVVSAFDKNSESGLPLHRRL